MAGSPGMVRGLFGEAPGHEFLILSMWQSAAEHGKYRAERVETARAARPDGGRRRGPDRRHSGAGALVDGLLQRCLCDPRGEHVTYAVWSPYECSIGRQPVERVLAWFDHGVSLVLVRHGESAGNADDTVYEREPDHALPLTEKGWQQAEETGERLREVFGRVARKRVRVALPPYARDAPRLPPRPRAHTGARGTRGCASRMGQLAGPRRRTPPEGLPGRLRAFDRFAQGESGADVDDRVGGFLESLYRSFEAPDHPSNVLLVTHGLAMRLFCMRWFHWTVAEFELLSNPGNAEMRMLVLGDDGKYTLDRPFERWCVPESVRGPRDRVAGR